MIPGLIIARLKMLAESTVRSTEPVRAIQPDPPPLQPGDRFRAFIVARNPDGSFRAQTQDRIPLTLTLPPPVTSKAGDEVDLVVLSREPAKPGTASPPTIRAQTVQTVPQLTNAAQLSGTARLIGALISESRSPPVALAGGSPLAGSAATPPAQIASLLRDAVARSGVFYESHQAGWIEGKIPLVALRLEPQAQLPAGTRLALPQADSDVTNQPTSLSGRPSEASSGRQPGEHPEQQVGDNVTRIVHRQLDTLSSHQLAWQVQPWPGLQMEWEIDAPDEQEASGRENPDAEWRTRLRLRLPQLGDVSAELSIAGNRIGIHLVADDSGSERLRQAGPALATALEAAGLRLIRATVSERG